MSAHLHATAAVVVDELECNFGKFGKLNDLPEISDGDEDSDAEDGYDELVPYGPEPVPKCLDKSATFPSTAKGLTSVASEEDGEPETALHKLFSEELPRTMSLPLLSAMKGSREKHGASPRKMSVTWAPDVYDPIPNSLSHSVKNKQKKSRKERDKDNSYNKKNGKKGQKGNSSRGSAGKDKKQFRKHGGRPDKCYKTLDATDDSNDFDVGSPDYCGGSFLKKSVAKFHYSVAEAL